MKRCKNLISGSIFIMTATAFVAAPLLSSAGVYDDCHAWWQFGFDYNNDGVAQTTDIRDQRNFHLQDTPGGPYDADYVYGSRNGAPQWTNIVAVSPAGGVTYGGKSMLFDPVTNAAGACWPDAFKVNDAAISYSATIVTRFRWDGFASKENNPGWICNNGLDWTNYRGWLFGIVQDGSNARLSINVRHAGYNLSNMNVETGIWYEAAAVLTHNESASDSIELYLWKEGTFMRNQRWNVDSVTNASEYLNIGGESGYGGYSTGNAFKSFKGALNHLALWDRPLSKAEIAEAFGAPQPIFQIGLENNNSADLGWDNEAPETYTMGEPWHLMRRAIKSGSISNAVIQVPFTSTEAALNYVFHVNTLTPDNQIAGLSLNINGTQLETLTASNDTDLCWFVTPDLLITGTNSFKLAYENGPAAYVVFDWLEIAGSWQIGVQNLSPSEFENEGSTPDDFYVTDPTFKNMERAISHGEPSTIINFALSDTVVSEYDFIYHTTIVSQGGDTPPHPFSIAVNGITVKSFDPVSDNTPISLPIHGRLLYEGNNTISLVLGETSGWLQFDYHKLNIQNPLPERTLILLR